METVNALGYVRRSKRSEERSISLDAQEEALRRYAAENNFTLEEVIRHDGVSGTKRARFDAINEAVDRVQPKAVLVYHLDRYGRDSSGVSDSLRRLASRGIDLHEVAGVGLVRFKKAVDKAFVTIRSATDQMYAELIGEKTSDALQHKKAQGLRYTRIPPLGYTYQSGLLVIDPIEQDALCIIARCRAQGLGARRTQRALREAGYTGRMGLTTIHRALNRPSIKSKLPAQYFAPIR